MISMQKLRRAVGGLRVETRRRILAFLVLAVCLLAIPQGAWRVDLELGSVQLRITTLPETGTHHLFPPRQIPPFSPTRVLRPSHTVPLSCRALQNFLFSNDTANPYLITVADGISLNLGNLTTASTGAVTISALPAGTGTLALAAGAHTFTLGLDQTTTVSLITSGEGGITKEGTGTLTMSGTNAYTGGTTINTGILSVGTIRNGGVAGNLGAATNAAANLVLGGGTLQYTGATDSTDRNFSAMTAGTTSSIDVTVGGTNLTLAGASTATTGGLTKLGAGTLTLSGANLYTGLTTITAGTLTLDATGTIGD